MVLIGIDGHKRTHTAVALDMVGRVLAQLTFTARTPGHLELLVWAAALAGGQPVVFAVEDCRHVTWLLERDLLAAGQELVRVPVKMMAAHRRRGRQRGKSDPIDARAVAEAVLREPDLPRAQVTAVTEAADEANLLVNHRDSLVNRRTALINSLHWHLQILDPDLEEATERLTRAKALAALTTRLEQLPASARVAIAAELIADITALNHTITSYERQIAALEVVTDSPLQSIPGCGTLTTAKIIGELGDITRFTSEEAFAANAGVAPIPVSSGNTQRVRLNRGGNRQLNRALHTIALYQMRTPGPGQDLYRAATARHKTHREAMRILKRHLARHIYRTLTKAARTSDDRLAA